MREFVKLSPKFWVGPTGRAVRKAGVEAQLVALYLLSSPHVSYAGIYHLPLVYISADTGLDLAAVRTALADIERTGFARYDEDSECVWVIEAAKWQIGESLTGPVGNKPGDAKIKYIQKEFDALPSDCPFKVEFMAKYGKAYHLRGAAPGVAEAPAAAPQAPTPMPREEQLFHSQVDGFNNLRVEKGLSTPASDKRIAAAALKLAHDVGYIAAANALYAAAQADDYEPTDLRKYVSEQALAAADI